MPVMIHKLSPPPQDPAASTPPLSLSSPGRFGTRRQVAFRAVLVLLPLAEALIVGVRFEGVDSTFGGGRWWSVLVAQGDVLFNVFLVSTAAFLLFGGRTLFEECRGHDEACERPSRSWLFLAAHLVAFVAFFRLTAEVLEGGVAASKAADVWVIGWAAAGFLTLELWGRGHSADPRLGSRSGSLPWLPAGRTGHRNRGRGP